MTTATAPPPALTPETAARRADGTLEAFRAQLDRVAGCTRPIRLSGWSGQADTRTGEIRRTFDSATQPDGTILIPCGNRRASVCPSCSYTYAGDAWQIVHSGLTGGRGVPAEVAEHPGLFVTVTAPSFGMVHTRNAGKGRPARTCHRLSGTCPHGQPVGCWRTHDDPADPLLGQALCLACYDLTGAVLWNATAARLWKRTVDLAYRRMAAQVGMPALGYTRRDGTRRVGLRDLIRISYVKVAEGQQRALIHYHAVMRLDGFDRDNPDAWPPPPAWATGKLLAACWRWAVERAREPCPSPTGAGAHDARWGEQHDEQHIAVDGGAELDGDTTMTGRRLSPQAVGNYLAKYTTKSVADGGALDRPIRKTADLFAVLPFLNPHQAAMVKTAWTLGGRRHLEALRLRANAHQYGYRGHWLTKSRRYSTTFGACRQERRDWNRTHDSAGNPRTPLDAWNRPLENDTGDEVIALGSWRFEGAGYRLAGDAQLAAMAADLARSRREAARDARDTARPS
ncbi:replication initiator [Pseudofrankia inefficax]|uniref:Plasmid replication initiator protein n=1 Tax=Pseudofrankia inefficax (strain DSM 45817 / CECT 9037 / DDB 130130 / EuI1c) TaxID=298654 RepID=E3IUL4_PSEI1|nr:replication initiator [Pseudofrankia inefficax]ADP84830.1 hypothetical protein FraEuI1c_6861 [Pseudofrankia inefficax]